MFARSSRFWKALGLAALAVIVTGLLLSSAQASYAQGGGQRRGPDQQGTTSTTGSGLLASNLPDPVAGALPAEVIEALIAGWTDEQHALAVYDGIIAESGVVQPFVNIRAAEAQHIAALETIFARYGLDIPAEVPAFDLPDVASVSDACAVAAEAEVANFALYDQWISTVQEYPDIVQVFTALRDASEFNHLPAFERCAG